MVEQGDQHEIVVAPRDDEVDGALLQALLGQRRDMVAAERDPPVRMQGLEALDVLPVTLDDGRLGLDQGHVGGELGEGPVELPGRPLLRDSVGPQDLVSLAGREGRGGGGDHGIDVGRLVEPLELPVLREQRNALLGRDGRIGDHHLHAAVSSDG